MSSHATFHLSPPDVFNFFLDDDDDEMLMGYYILFIMIVLPWKIYTFQR